MKFLSLKTDDGCAPGESAAHRLQHDDVALLHAPITDADIDAAVEMIRRGVRRCIPSKMPEAAK